MSLVVEYDPSNPIVANKMCDCRRSINTPDYSGNPNTLVNPDLSAVSGVEWRYWKESTGSIIEMTAGEKTDIDAWLATQQTE